MGKTVEYAGPSAKDDQSGYVTIHDANGENPVTLYQGKPQEVSDDIVAVIEAGIEGHKFEVSDSAGDEFEQLKGAALEDALKAADLPLTGSVAEKRQALRDKAATDNQGS